jgi:isopenicillin N synthase-like dioxygenase
VAVPVIDLSAGRDRVVDGIGRACAEIGFLTVVGHGVPEELVDWTADVSRTFFDLPDEEKRILAEGDPRPGLPAYRPFASESLAATLGQAAPGDLKESLDWGPAVPGFGWPRRPSTLRVLFEEYHAALSGLGGRLRRLFALALGLPEDWFEDAFRDHSSSMRVINYPDPEVEAEPGRLRAGAHTDYGCMTILRTEAVPGGLQVQARSGDWLDVEAVPGSFVVNLGDMMARWTNDRWPATLHRVAVPPPDRLQGSRRQTIVFFHDPRGDAVIDCIPGCADETHPPRYEPVTALEHVQAKAAQALRQPSAS